MPRKRKPASPFRYFNSLPEVIRFVAMIYVRFPLSLLNGRAGLALDLRLIPASYQRAPHYATLL